jgi:FtsZ-binding cell division protein ZapB
MSLISLSAVLEINRPETMFRHAVRMSTQSAAANVHPFMRIFPAPPPDAFDSVPTMRREITLLRIEVERLRAIENEARETKEFLIAHIDRLMESRDRWQREAERLSALVAQVPCSAHDATLDRAHWSLFWWRRAPRR